MRREAPSRSRRARRATAVGLVGNGLLFAVKGTIGLLSGSIAVLSDAFNSLVDVVASIAIFWSVEVAHREADADHPFGHHRAETIAALGVAIFTAILGFEIGRAAVQRLVEGPEPIDVPGLAIGALGFSMVGNLLLGRYLRRRGEALESPAILANAVECENDIWTSLAALGGVTGAILGWPAVDPVAGIVVGAWIMWGGWRFGRQNIDYLMGKSPGRELLERIRATAHEVRGVRGVHDVRGHYVGHRIHVEVHVEVDQELRTRQSHDVGEEVADSIETLPGIDRAFVHVDPVLERTFVVETLARRERRASRIYEAFAEDAGESALGSVWQALATRALLRAERLETVQRLRGAGWHFADADVPPEEAEGGLERIEALERRVEAAEAIGTAEAVEIAEAIEADDARGGYLRAVTPLDPGVRGSIDAAVPPAPTDDHVRSLVARAAREAGDPAAREALERLARRIEEGPGG